jgi:hypothetical protein
MELKMFNANELNLNFLKEISSEPQLVIIPVNNEYGVIAVVKSLGGGKAACIAFSPATRLDNPFQGYRPTFLRKMITTDFPMREGRWTPLEIKNAGAQTLRSAVTVLLRDFENLNESAIKEVEMRRPTNASSSPEVSAITFSSPENVQFEKALGHLVGLEFTMARAIAKKQAELIAHAAEVVTPAVISNETHAEAPVEVSVASASVSEPSTVSSSQEIRYESIQATAINPAASSCRQVQHESRANQN